MTTNTKVIANQFNNDFVIVAKEAVNGIKQVQLIVSIRII